MDQWPSGGRTKDLKGKVVLIDFWAIWHGPCIATFPHLREWREKYSDKGLVIIGLTRKYNYEWNADTGRASKIQGENTVEQEHEMLAHFAKHHQLKHVFGIQKDRAISDYYGSTATSSTLSSWMTKRTVVISLLDTVVWPTFTFMPL
jgi:thiol-disulfide isomerase/thioredoxin